MCMNLPIRSMIRHLPLPPYLKAEMRNSLLYAASGAFVSGQEFGLTTIPSMTA